MTVHGLDLLDEKNLWQIYRQCVLRLAPSRFNLGATSIVLLILICECAYFPEHFSYRIDTVRSLAELGLGFGTTILGFLIAGFTIFATLSKPELFRKMYDTPHTPSGLSYFKKNFFAFVEVFVVYLAFLVACLIVKLFGAPGGVVSLVIEQSARTPVEGYYFSKSWFANISYIFLGSFSFYSLLSLKSFVYNTYHTVITSVVWSLNTIAKTDKNS